MNILIEMLTEQFDEYQVEISAEQIKAIASDIETHYEMQAEMEFHATGGRRTIQDSEVERLKLELKRERVKTVCERCNGKGYITSYFLNRSSIERCYVCNGEGRL